MFSPKRTSPLRQRALGALRLTRSFLLLEDDHEFGWEAEQEVTVKAIHPHRAPLQRAERTGRPGEPVQAPMACLSPIVSRRPRRLRPERRLAAKLQLERGCASHR